MPLRLQLAFLDSVGAGVLPAQPARAPLVFTLLDTASGDATVPAGTPRRCGAAAAAHLARRQSDTQPPRLPEFFTEQEITAMRGALAALYSIDPQADTYADHSAATPGDFAVLEARDAGAASPLPRACRAVPARRLGGDRADVRLRAPLSPDGAPDAGQRPLLLDWEYLSADGWQPLRWSKTATAASRATAGSRWQGSRAGQPGDDRRAASLSCWIRATVSAADAVRAHRAALADGVDAPEGAVRASLVESSIELLRGRRRHASTVRRAAAITATCCRRRIRVRLDALVVDRASDAGEYLIAGGRAAAAAARRRRPGRRAAAGRRDPRAGRSATDRSSRRPRLP